MVVSDTNAKMPWCEINQLDDYEAVSEGSGDEGLVTPQPVIDSMPHFTVRKRGAFCQPDCSCGICFEFYSVGDRIICLPCHHNFHMYCIESWLRWVKPSCPIDKKAILPVEVGTLKSESDSLELTAKKSPSLSLSGDTVQETCSSGKSAYLTSEKGKSPHCKGLKTPIKTVPAKNFIEVRSPFGAPRQEQAVQEKHDDSPSEGQGKKRMLANENRSKVGFKNTEKPRFAHPVEVSSTQANQELSKADRARLKESVNRIREGLQMTKELDNKPRKSIVEYENELEALASKAPTPKSVLVNSSRRMSSDFEPWTAKSSLSSFSNRPRQESVPNCSFIRDKYASASSAGNIARRMSTDYELSHSKSVFSFGKRRQESFSGVAFRDIKF